MSGPYWFITMRTEYRGAMVTDVESFISDKHPMVWAAGMADTAGTNAYTSVVFYARIRADEIDDYADYIDAALKNSGALTNPDPDTE